MAFDPEVLLKILQSVASQNQMTTPALTSLPMGLSSSSITSTMNPEVLFASGLYDPSLVNAGIEAALRDQQSQYAKDILNATQLPSAPFEYWSYKQLPRYSSNPVLAEFMSDTANMILNGEQGYTNPDDAKVAIASVIGSRPELAPYANLLPTIQSDIDTLFKESEQNLRAKAEYDFKTQNAIADANARAQALGLSEPSRQSAMAEYYKSIGLPQLAVLPDPTEQFQLDPSIFLNQAENSQAFQLYQQLDRLRQRASMPEFTQLPKQVVSAQGEQDKMARTAAESAAKRIAEAKKQEFITQQTSARKEPKGKSWWDPRGVVDVMTGNDPSSKNERFASGLNVKADALYKKVYAEELAKNLKKYSKTITPKDISPTYGSVNSQIAKTEALLKNLLSKGVTGSKQATSMLTSSGITPFSQAMNQILTNAALQGAKRR